ncbi:MAG: FMN-binding protein [Microbacterium sp.]
MIRTAPVSRPARAGAALAGVAGILALAGCAGATTSAQSTGGSGVSYADGTYTAEGTYSTPESVETISVTLTLEDDTISAVDVVGDPQEPESVEYQGKFIGGIADEVVGKDIDEISVSRVAGSSLTSAGFNQAVEEIRQQAAA